MKKEKYFLQELKARELQKEKVGWLFLAGENLAKIWDNPQDKKIGKAKKHISLAAQEKLETIFR